MPKTRIEATQSVIELLNAAETRVDDAFSSVASFNAFLPSARQQAHVAAEVGQEALEHAAEAMQHLLRARAAMVASHKALAVVKSDLGLDTVNFGGLGGKPKTAHVPALQAVRAA